MPYEANWTRSAPACVLFVVDQSHEMANAAAAAARTINDCLMKLVVHCTTFELVDKCCVGAIGYRARARPEIRSLFPNLSEGILFPISILGQSPARVVEETAAISTEDGGREYVPVRRPEWIDPLAEGTAPLGQALIAIRELLEHWTRQHPHGFPPLVALVSSGAASDGDFQVHADEVKRIATSDGQALIVAADCGRRTLTTRYPASESELVDPNARRLYNLASVLPAPFLQDLQEQGEPAIAGSRGYVPHEHLPGLFRTLISRESRLPRAPAPGLNLR